MGKRAFSFLAGLLLVAAVLAGCATTRTNRFLVYKHGRAFYFASRSEGLKTMLCASGDFKRVLAAAPAVPAATSEGLYYYTCTKPDPNKVQALFVTLTPAQRKAMLNAFMDEGYLINFWPCN
ncbi:MAG: hypothetical protein M0018_05500 [Nitrospiraceae bacterium]|nr:hypothetical protein [Nitrospiraceae bacterium]